MTQPDAVFQDGPPMPEMCEGVLSNTDLQDLFDDIASCTQVLSVQEKVGRQEHAGAGPAALHAAKSRLLTNDVRAVQIRYAYDGCEWTDTLLSLPMGFRLVRCQHSFSPDPDPPKAAAAPST